MIANGSSGRSTSGSLMGNCDSKSETKGGDKK